MGCECSICVFFDVRWALLQENPDPKGGWGMSAEYVL
jgi:hypothetical protein